MEVLIFGHPRSQATRAAQRWFAERRIPVHQRDLRKRPASPKELRRWADPLGTQAIIDETSAVYREEGLAYLQLDDEGWLARASAQPLLLRLPLVRHGGTVAVGQDPEGWARIAAAAGDGPSG